MLVITQSKACEERHVSLKLSTGAGERTVAILDQDNRAIAAQSGSWWLKHPTSSFTPNANGSNTMVGLMT